MTSLVFYTTTITTVDTKKRDIENKMVKIIESGRQKQRTTTDRRRTKTRKARLNGKQFGGQMEDDRGRIEN